MTITEAIELLENVKCSYGDVAVYFDCPTCKQSFAPQRRSQQNDALAKAGGKSIMQADLAAAIRARTALELEIAEAQRLCAIGVFAIPPLMWDAIGAEVDRLRAAGLISKPGESISLGVALSPYQHDCEQWAAEGIGCAYCNPSAIACREAWADDPIRKRAEQAEADLAAAIRVRSRNERKRKIMGAGTEWICSVCWCWFRWEDQEPKSTPERKWICQSCSPPNASSQANALIASVRVPDSSTEEIITIDEDGTVSANGQNIGPIRER